MYGTGDCWVTKWVHIKHYGLILCVPNFWWVSASFGFQNMRCLPKMDQTFQKITDSRFPKVSELAGSQIVLMENYDTSMMLHIVSLFPWRPLRRPWKDARVAAMP